MTKSQTVQHVIVIVGSRVTHHISLFIELFKLFEIVYIISY